MFVKLKNLLLLLFILLNYIIFSQTQPLLKVYINEVHPDPILVNIDKDYLPLFSDKKENEYLFQKDEKYKESTSYILNQLKLDTCDILYQFCTDVHSDTSLSQQLKNGKPARLKNKPELFNYCIYPDNLGDFLWPLLPVSNLNWDKMHIYAELNEVQNLFDNLPDTIVYRKDWPNSIPYNTLITGLDKNYYSQMSYDIMTKDSVFIRPDREFTHIRLNYKTEFRTISKDLYIKFEKKRWGISLIIIFGLLFLNIILISFILILMKKRHLRSAVDEEEDDSDQSEKNHPLHSSQEIQTISRKNEQLCHYIKKLKLEIKEIQNQQNNQRNTYENRLRDLQNKNEQLNNNLQNLTTEKNSLLSNIKDKDYRLIKYKKIMEIYKNYLNFSRKILHYLGIPLQDQDILTEDPSTKCNNGFKRFTELTLHPFVRSNNMKFDVISEHINQFIKEAESLSKAGLIEDSKNILKNIQEMSDKKSDWMYTENYQEFQILSDSLKTTYRNEMYVQQLNDAIQANNRIYFKLRLMLKRRTDDQYITIYKLIFHTQAIHHLLQSIAIMVGRIQHSFMPGDPVSEYFMNQEGDKIILRNPVFDDPEIKNTIGPNEIMDMAYWGVVEFRPDIFVASKSRVTPAKAIK